MKFIHRIIKLFHKTPPVATGIIEGRCSIPPHPRIDYMGGTGDAVADKRRWTITPETAAILARSVKNARWN